MTKNKGFLSSKCRKTLILCGARGFLFFLLYYTILSCLFLYHLFMIHLIYKNLIKSNTASTKKKKPPSTKCEADCKADGADKTHTQYLLDTYQIPLPIYYDIIGVICFPLAEQVGKQGSATAHNRTHQAADCSTRRRQRTEYSSDTAADAGSDRTTHGCTASRTHKNICRICHKNTLPFKKSLQFESLPISFYSGYPFFILCLRDQSPQIPERCPEAT